MIKKGLIVRHLVLPNHLQNSKKILKWIRDHLGTETYVSVMAQYFPTYKAKETKDINRKITKEEYREIENYIPENLIKRYYGRENSKQKFGKYENIEDYIDKLKRGEGKKFLRDKTDFARKILEISKWEDFESVYDLEKTISKVELEILGWNYME